VLSGDCGDGHWTSAADIEEERSFLVRIKSTRPDIVQSAGYAGQLKVDVATSEHNASLIN